MAEVPRPEARLYERLMAIFPGYRGYKERELIRETDRLVRDSLYTRMKRASEALWGAFRAQVASKGYVAEAQRLEALLYRLDALAERVRHAPYGYKPLFHVVKADEAKLERLLEHDVKLGEGVGRLEALASSTADKVARGDDASRELGEIESLLRELDARISERDSILAGMGGGT